MKTRGKWVGFLLLPKTGKTQRWEVYSKRDKIEEEDLAGGLGLVKWYAPWRRYVFFPESGTLFDAACLREIAAFCAYQMQLRRGDTTGGEG